MTDPKESSSVENDPELAINVIRIYSPQLADATEGLVVWLADALCSEGLLDTRVKDDLLSTSGVSAHNKAIQIWSQIRVNVKLHKNPRQAFLTVCNVMKQRKELESLAQAMILQLRPSNSSQSLSSCDNPTEELHHLPNDNFSVDKTTDNWVHPAASTGNAILIDNLAQETRSSLEYNKYFDLLSNINVWFHLGNFCFLVAILSDIVLILGNSTWSMIFWAESLPYPIFVVIFITMTKSVKSFYPIGLFYILVFYELMCLTTFTDLLALNPKDGVVKYPRYDELTVAKWFAKELCKIPLYMELGFYFKKNAKFIKYLFYSLFTQFGFGFMHLIYFFFINKPNTLVVIIFILIAIIGVCFGINGCSASVISANTDKLLLFAVYGILELICGYIILGHVPQKFNETRFILSLANFGAGILLVILVDDSPLVTVIMKVAWKISNVVSVIVYLFDVTYQLNEFSFLLVILDIVVITSVILITLNFRSNYAVITIVLLLLIHLIFAIYKSSPSNSGPAALSHGLARSHHPARIHHPALSHFPTLDDGPVLSHRPALDHGPGFRSSVFLITQVTCQLTIIGALLYTNGYNYGRKP